MKLARGLGKRRVARNAVGAHAPLAGEDQRDLRVLATGQALATAIVPLGITLASVQARHLSGTAFWAGIAVAIQVAAGVVALAAATFLVARFGRRKLLFAGFSTLSIGAALLGVAGALESLPLLLGGCAVFGAGAAVAQTVRGMAAAIHGRRVDAASIGLVTSAGAIGSALGPLSVALAIAAGAALGVGGHAPPWVVASILAAAGTLVIRALPRDGLSGGAASGIVDALRSPRRLLGRRTVRIAIASMAANGATMVVMMLVTANELDQRSASATTISLVMSVHVFAMYAFAVPAGWLSERIGHLQVIAGGLAFTIGGSALVAMRPSALPLAFALIALGAGWSASFVASVTLVSEATSEADRTGVIALMELAVASLTAVALVAAGWGLSHGGVRSVVAAMTLLALTAAVWLARTVASEPRATARKR